MRVCDVCGREAAESLHRQEFLTAGDRRLVHDIVACGGCGFAYARRSGQPEDLAAYYEASRKYVHDGTGGRAKGLDEAHAGFAAFVTRVLEPIAGKGAAILDVGCAAGYLLVRLREAGFGDVQGLEPSANARETAMRLYGIQVSGERIEEYRPRRLFDAVILSSVLEHIEEPGPFVQAAARLLSPTGVLFVQVPDAERFGIELEEPFQEFSIEHVSFFTGASLRRLLAVFGLAPAEVIQEVMRSGASRGPVITSAFRRASGSPGPDERSDPAPIADYVRRSRARLAEMEEVVAHLVDSGEEFLVWGAGALTARLLATTRLGEGRIRAFVDSDRSLHGRRLAGRPIAPPETLRGSNESVLVASVRWGPEIRATLSGELGHRGRVLSLERPPRA